MIYRWTGKIAHRERTITVYNPFGLSAAKDTAREQVSIWVEDRLERYNLDSTNVEQYKARVLRELEPLLNTEPIVQHVPCAFIDTP